MNAVEKPWIVICQVFSTCGVFLNVKSFCGDKVHRKIHKRP